MIFPVSPPHARRRRAHRAAATPVFHVARASASLTAQPAADAAAAAVAATRNASREKQLASLLAGGIAGTLSATITCPMEVVKTRASARPLGEFAPH